MVLTGMIAASAPVKCESNTNGGDWLDVQCPLSSSTRAQRFRFEANFGGSHDDTTVSMTLTLNDRPVTCDAGYKTQAVGEEGEVTLECTFPVAGKASAQVLKANLKWHHAYHTRYELVSVP